MLSPLQEIATEVTPAAVIRLTIPRDQIQQVMSPAISELLEAVTAQGIGPVGPVFSHHFQVNPEFFDFEVGVPISGELHPAGRVVPGALPAAKVMRTIYTGPYEGLGEAWGEFMGQLRAAGHFPAENAWERYLSDPTVVTNPADYQTELNRPLQEDVIQ
jgi:effector-binding domain-containing protein